MRYAINLYDLGSLQRHDQTAALLFPPTILGTVINVNPLSVARDAVTLICSEERAAAIMRLLRTRYRKSEIHLYQSQTGRGGWQRI